MGTRPNRAHSSRSSTRGRSVEEQFYIFIPVLLIGLAKWRSAYIVPALVLLALLSMQFAHFYWTINKDAAFFLLPSRAWELLAGSALAAIEMKNGERRAPEWLSAILPALGLFLVGHSIVFFHEDMHHPSFLTALPILGVVLLLWFMKPGELVTDVLSSAPMRFVGKVSYSFYLWHWPVFVFARIQLRVPTDLQMLGLIGLSFGLSVLSYIFIEQPFRNRATMGWRPVWGAIVASLLVVGAFQGYALWTKGAPSRLGDYELLYAESRRADLLVDGAYCHMRTIPDHCAFNKGRGLPLLVNSGDSHADTYGLFLKQYADEKGYEFRHITQSGCAFVLDATFPGAAIPDLCGAANPAIKDWLAEIPPATIIYTPRWKIYTGFYNDQWVVPANGDDIFTAFGKTFDYITSLGHKLIIVDATMESSVDLPTELMRVLASGGPISSKDDELTALLASDLIKYEENLAENAVFTDFLNAYAKTNPSVRVVSMLDIQCDIASRKCPNMIEGKLTLEDKDHFSPITAEMAVEKIAEVIGSWR